MADKITMDEWLAELQRVDEKTGGDGFTARDLARAKGRSMNWAQSRIRRGVEAGVLVHAGWRVGTKITGDSCQRPIYKPVKREAE